MSASSPAAQGHVLAATATTFDTLVIENSRKGPVLVDFWAPWAGPSLRQGELLRRLAAEYGGRFLLVSVDTGREKALAERFGVKSLPSCKLFRHGRVVEQIHGMQTEADYRVIIDRHLPVPADQVQATALELWAAGEQDRAIQVLADAAVAEPKRVELPLLIAKLLARSGRHEDAFELLDALPQALRDDRRLRSLHTHLTILHEAAAAAEEPALLAGIEAEPDRLELRLSLAARRLVADDWEGALAELAEIYRRDPGYRDSLARHAMLAVIDQLGAGDPRVGTYRRMLFRH